MSTSFNTSSPKAQDQVVNLQDFRSLKQAHVWYFNEEDPEGNYAVLKNLLAEEPELALAWRLLAETCLNLDLPQEALASLFKAIALEPTCGEAWGLAAFALYALGKPYWAAGMLKQAFKLNDDSMADLKLPFFELAIDLAYEHGKVYRLKRLWAQAKQQLTVADFIVLHEQLQHTLSSLPLRTSCKAASHNREGKPVLVLLP